MTAEIERDSMQYDVVIVGAGPSGLGAAIKIKQLAQEQEREVSVCVVEKGSEVGSHILSGAVLDPKALNELIPNWREKNAPISCAVTKDKMYFLTKKQGIRLPTAPSFHNKGNYIISLGLLCKWLAEQAENLGVEIYPGFAATEIVYHEDGSVKGIQTGDVGIDKTGQPSGNYQPGMLLLAQQTIIAEGCRGSLAKKLIHQFQLDKDSQAQTYGIGIKEIWEVDSPLYEQGTVAHTVGWPLDSNTYGGSFIYHLEDNKVAIGFVVGLDYRNPYLSPFEEFQRFKTHPKIRPLFENGRRIAYGARALAEGGYQSLPRLYFPGGVLVGDSAGVLNVPRIKGIHMSLKSGMLAAQAVFNELEESQEEYTSAKVVSSYQQIFNTSWLKQELYQVRNIRPAFKWGMYIAFAYSALEDYLFKGKMPWTFSHHGYDYRQLKLAKDAQMINYPKADGVLTFDRLSSVFLSNTHHEENQPSHLYLKDCDKMIKVNFKEYASPETRYCPAGVYEIVNDNQEVKLQINAANCLHCKTCDIKDPTQNIVWTCPEGGGGPNYSEM